MKTFMPKNFSPLLACTLAVLVVCGCATTSLTPDTGPKVKVGRLAKPGRIFVYRFAATSADVPPESRDLVAVPGVAPTAEEVQVGREMGTIVAERLVENINDMGMKAVFAAGGASPRVGDIAIHGHFQSIEEGNAAGRMAIGFGSGKAELQTVVVAYVMTENGMRRVGGGTVDSAGGKGPGLFVPALVTAATANPIGLVVMGAAKVEGEMSGRTKVEGAAKRTADAISDRLEKRFEDEGWI